MHVLGKNSNSNLLILGGIAAVAALALLNRNQASTGGGGGGGSTAAPLFGTDGTSYPSIFQLPSETFAGFPSPADSGDVIGNLLKSLGGGYQVNSAGPAVVKTPAGSGNVAAVTTPLSKKDAVAMATKNAIDMTPIGMGINSQLLGGFFGIPTYGDMVGAMAGALVGNGSKTPTAAEAAASLPAPFRSSPSASTGVKDFAGASVSESVSQQTKKEAYVSGYSGQYINDNGVLYWNPYNGFGLSTDPVTGNAVPYQRDIYISDASGLVYAPDGSVGSKKDALRVIDVPSGTFGHSRELDAAEYAKSWAFTVGQQGQAWDDIRAQSGSTKKEASISSPSSGGSTDWSSVQSSATTASAFNDAVSSAWADSYGPGSGW